MAKPTAQELADEAERVTPIGFFNFADTYWTAAKTLRRSKAKATHRDSPIRFAYYHAIELYLKAYLRGCDIHPFDLRTKFGHKAGTLAQKARSFGLELDDEDEAVIDLMTQTDAVIRSRYVATGFFQWPDLGALERTCKSLRASVGPALHKLGQPVRINLRPPMGVKRRAVRQGKGTA